MELSKADRALAAGIAAAHPLEGRGPALKAFTIRIGRRGSPRLEFGAMARNTVEAIDQHICLAVEGERVEALPVRSEAELLAADVQHAQHKAARFHQRNDRMAHELDVDAMRRAGAL